ncbi:SDR family NAD(P)-dependent oxidoreductase [Lacisediminimonas sp.]|uniref:SDR family NAD(P)-dependent oxidoreductase n=1 Tax=Lacisediminimonas sp. TaxID=3060582 RepID=UPI0027197D5B|nr:SDR family NAD(P)-dependent oxidoreductase [Lacisediminimonas sp.]MDO8298723.1 SDR family NAD(P)-dependent oxidoreductase [Lacisediminimonas sp.]MDO9218209.1 SDR family NAD(P)-dependent oxidoreductase [Lacisediminimonas sp.]
MKDKDASLAGGRVAIVTGGATGVGLAICTRLAQDGIDVVVADRDLNAAQAAATMLGAMGVQTLALGTDVGSDAALEQMVAATMERFGRIDYLVNNAGVLGPIKPLWELTSEEVAMVYDLNVKAVFTATRLVVRHMLERKSGSIVSLASVAGKDGPKNMSIYASSKAAVIGFTKSWAKELAPLGIRVNCVSPSLISSTGMQNAMPAWFVEDSISRIPMGRAASADEVANVINFLLSDQAAFVTGACYDVSGGRAVY